MGTKTLAPHLKKVATGQAQTRGGRSTFMQSGTDRAEGLRTIGLLSGSGRHCVIVDVLTLLVRERWRTRVRSPAWLRQDDPTPLHRENAAYFQEFEHQIRNELSSDCLVVFVVDGEQRPAAKEAELARRARRHAQDTAKLRKRLPGARHLEHASTLWVTAHDEADVLINFLVSPVGTGTPVDQQLFGAAPIQAAKTLVAAIPPDHRTIVSRDTDLPACNTAGEVGWFLWTDWAGAIPDVVLDGAPPRDRAPPPAPSAPFRIPTPPPAAGEAAASAPAPGAETAAAAQPRQHTTPRGPVVAAKARKGRGGDKQTLPDIVGRYILLRASGLDALPALGADRRERIFAWALTDNDYLRGGVGGFTFNVYSTGLLRPFLSTPFSDPTAFERELGELVRKLGSTSAEHAVWRNGAKVKKRKSGQLDAGVASRVLEAIHIASGVQAAGYISEAGRRFLATGLDYGERPPTLERGGSLRHGYLGRPDPDQSGIALPRLDRANPRFVNPLQPRRPASGAKAFPSTARFKPRAPGESIVNAAQEYEPEPREINPQALAEHRAQRAQQEERRQAATKQRAEWEKARAKEQQELRDRGDDEFELQGGRSTLPRLEDRYAGVMSHEQPCGAVFRDFTSAEIVAAKPASAESRRPATAGRSPKHTRHRSGAQQKQAKQRRITRPPPRETATPAVQQPAAPSSDARARPSCTNPRLPESPPEGTASFSPVATLFWLAAQLSTTFLPAAYRALTVARLGLGEAGVQQISAAAREQNGIAREFGVLAQFAEPTFDGSGLKDDSLRKAEFSTAAAAAREAGNPLPVRVPATVWVQTYLPLQTAINNLPEQWISDDLCALGHFVGSDFERHASHALEFVFAQEHQTLSLATASRDLLIAIASVPAVASETSASLADLLGRILRDTPFSDAVARAGAEAADKRQIPHGARASKRDSTRAKSRQSQDFHYGLAPHPPELARQEPQVAASAVKLGSSGPASRPVSATSAPATPLTGNATGSADTPATAAVLPRNYLDQEHLEELDQLLQSGYDKVRQEAPATTDPGAVSVRELAKDIIEVAFRLLAFRDRHIDIALNLSGCSKKEACVGKSVAHLIGGNAPLPPKAFRKSLLALTFSLRRMRNVAEAEVFPVSLPRDQYQVAVDCRVDSTVGQFFDPTWVNVSIEHLATLSEPGNLNRFLSDLEDRTTSAARALLPRIRHVDRHGAELLAFMREHFDLVRQDGSVWDWDEAERVGARATRDDAGTAALAHVCCVVRPHLRQRAEGVDGVLRSTFQIAELTTGNSIAVRHAKAELVNIAARRAVQAQNLIPTGMMQLSAHHVRFFGVKLDCVKEGHLAEAEGKSSLDAGQFWSQTAQAAWSQLALSDYYAGKKPVYELRHAGSGSWSTDEIPPIAQPGADAMMASRRPPAPPRPPPPRPPPPRMPVPSTRPRSIRLRQQTRLDRSKAQSKRRLGRPAELRKKIKRAPPTEKTVDGLPASWGELRKGETRRRLDDFVRDREPDQRAYVGVDLGVRNPVAAYLSIPTSVPGMVDGRAEASVVYRRDTLLAMQRRNSSMMSHINTNLRRQVDLSRTASTSRTPGRDDGTADDEATDEQATIDMWVNVLTKAHPVRERTQIRYAVEREAEMRRFTSELARAMAGGNEGRSRAELAELRWVVFVGDEMNEATGASGAQSHNVILRHLPIELRRRGMQAMFVRTPESYTSQRCH
ncbi:hypothetical protein JCM8202_005022 [Rhodotorula sphaerocarpa]